MSIVKSATEKRKYDVIAMGRAGLDLYATQHKQSFELVQSFEKFVGGSPANTIAALAKRGAETGFISKLSNDPVGQYVRSYLSSIGVDLSNIFYADGEARTSLAITEMKPEDCAVVIYRNDAADLQLSPQDIDEEYIAHAHVLLISGACLSHSPAREAALLAAYYAMRNNTTLVLDIDYRPYSWKSPEEVALYYSLIAEKCNIIIGNRGEFDAIEYLWNPHNSDDRASAERWFQHAADLVIIKHGEEGSNAYLRTEQGIECTNSLPFPAESSIKKPFGAGDAFAGNLLFEILQDKPLDYALQRGAAAATIVICKDSCSDANPTSQELDTFMQRSKRA